MHSKRLIALQVCHNGLRAFSCSNNHGPVQANTALHLHFLKRADNEAIQRNRSEGYQAVNEHDLPIMINLCKPVRIPANLIDKQQKEQKKYPDERDFPYPNQLIEAGYEV